MPADRKENSESLAALERGDAEGANKLMPLVYDELRSLAARYLRRERPDHTLQPTALVHEAYLRLVNTSQISWQGKSHFYALAAREMRRVLIDHARRHRAKKRGENRTRIQLEESTAIADTPSTDLMDLDSALRSMNENNPRQARVAELRLFGGLKISEMACVLDVSERTIKEDWRFARAWLRRELSGETE